MTGPDIILSITVGLAGDPAVYRVDRVPNAQIDQENRPTTVCINIEVEEQGQRVVYQGHLNRLVWAKSENPALVDGWVLDDGQQPVGFEFGIDDREFAGEKLRDMDREGLYRVIQRLADADSVSPFNRFKQIIPHPFKLKGSRHESRHWGCAICDQSEGDQCHTVSPVVDNSASSGDPEEPRSGE